MLLEEKNSINKIEQLLTFFDNCITNLLGKPSAEWKTAFSTLFKKDNRKELSYYKSFSVFNSLFLFYQKANQKANSVDNILCLE